MESLRIQAALLRAQLPDLVLREGMQFTARVAERTERLGIIMLAGAPLTAELPDEVRAGDVLRLTVAETGAERVVLRLTDPPALPPPVAGVGVPLPGGAAGRITAEEREAGGRDDAGRDAVHVTYTSATLGAFDLALTLAPDGVLVTVGARAGTPVALAEAAAEELRDAVGRATGRPAAVHVWTRHDPLDVYA